MNEVMELIKLGAADATYTMKSTSEKEIRKFLMSGRGAPSSLLKVTGPTRSSFPTPVDGSSSTVARRRADGWRAVLKTMPT